MPKNIRITPLCHRTLKKSLTLVLSEFHTPPLLEHPCVTLPLSLCFPQGRWALRLLFRIDLLHYWIAVENTHPIGIIGLYGWRSQSSIAWIGWYCVAPTWRRQGVGALLLEWVIEQARQEGKTQLQVYTSGTSAACGLYESAGFSVIDCDAERVIYLLSL